MAFCTLLVVQSCLAAGSYQAAVTKAVSFGGDTDTHAAIVGGLAGLVYGYESIPEEWINSLRGQPLVEQLLARFSIYEPSSNSNFLATRKLHG